MKWFFRIVITISLISCSSLKVVNKNVQLIKDINELASGSLVDKLSRANWNMHDKHELLVLRKELCTLKKLLKEKEKKQLQSYMLLKSIVSHIEVDDLKGVSNKIDFTDPKIIAQFKLK